MIVVLNGSFGVGKTTIARRLREVLRGSVVFDPEWAGVGLMRVPGWVGLRGAGTDDFQDIALWRKSAVVGARLFRFFARGPLIVPMTFTCRAYFDEVVEGLRRCDPELRVYCLRASLPTVQKRLEARGTKSTGPEAEWLARRIAECAEAHRDPHFGEPIATEARDAREVAAELVRRLQRPTAATA